MEHLGITKQEKEVFTESSLLKKTKSSFCRLFSLLLDKFTAFFVQFFVPQEFVTSGRNPKNGEIYIVGGFDPVEE